MSAADDPHAFDLDDLEATQGGLFAAARRRAAGQPDEPTQTAPQPAQAAPAAAPQPKPTTAPKAQLPAADEPLSAADLVKRLRARLKVVEREIKTRKALEAERAQLKRLLDAAQEKPARVRRIHQAG